MSIQPKFERHILLVTWGNYENLCIPVEIKTLTLFLLSLYTVMHALVHNLPTTLKMRVGRIPAFWPR